MKSKVKTTKRSYLSKDDLGLSEIWLWGVFIIFPLIYNKHYFDILETKFATFTVLSLGLIVLFSLYKLMSFFGKEGSGKVSFIDLLKNNFDIIDMGMLVFILVSVISTLAAAPYVNEAFWGNEGRHTGLFLLLLYVICFFIVSRYLEFKPHFINAFLIVGFLICLFGITDYFGMDILDFKEKGAELIFTTGGMSVDPDDLTPTAIKETGADIVKYGASALPGAMFMMAYLDDVPIMGVPACGMFFRTTVVDLLLPRIFSGEKIEKSDIVKFGVGGLCMQCEECVWPKCTFGK